MRIIIKLPITAQVCSYGESLMLFAFENHGTDFMLFYGIGWRVRQHTLFIRLFQQSDRESVSYRKYRNDTYAVF